ncbi:MAG TPA: M20 family metallopeptidase [Acidimicrobiales bacterium]|nr:M20 family metallopeptidase [Acidimicrobiales bacterium]
MDAHPTSRAAMDLEALKASACAEVDRWADRLVGVARQIHAQPELAYEERFAHDLLTGLLEEAGLAPERSALGFETAFRAAAGSSGPTVAVLCEYDALPGIGHACGHNVIAAAGLGAALATAPLARGGLGRVVVLGTPAEEGGGGKIELARRGAFDGIDAAMMVHPADADLSNMDCVAIQQLEVTFSGEAAHAAAAPHRGRNALDAAVLGYLNVAALRQHIRPTERIHGIFTRAGDKPNIVPDHAAALWYVRSDTIETLQPLKQRVLACLEAGAAAAGCSCEHAWDNHPYADMRDNGPIGAAYAANAARLGRVVTAPDQAHRVVGSTDMGNVSYLAPSIHPMIKVAPEGVPIHTPEFARYAGREEADRAVLDGAKAMAMTVVDLWADAAVFAAARAEFERATAGAPSPL